MKKHFLLLAALLFPLFFLGQTPETLPPEYIRTIEFKGSSEFSGTPVVKLGQRISLEFDDLIGDEVNYYYKIKHFNFDWTPSDLSQNEYLIGFDDMRIKNQSNSFNTLQIYTHYTLNIPNADTRGLKVSGNYMLEIYDDEESLVFSKRFIVYENIASVRTEIKRSRDVKYLNSKQVVNFTISGGDHILFKNPDQNLKTLVIKNNNLQNSIYNLTPQYRMANEFIYRYDRESSFNGGNEFLYFDSKDVRGSNVNIRRIDLTDIYNIYLYTDVVRANDNYTYNPDINGNFVITTMQGNNPKIESEYTWVYFTLKYDALLQRDDQLHIYGGFNGYTLDHSTRMTYNSKTGLYEGKLLLKQGFYNYDYVIWKTDGSIDDTTISGSHDKTENEYMVIAYYKEPGSRYDRVVGVGTANSENITN